MEGALHYSQPRVLSSLPHTASSSQGCLLTPWVSLFFCASLALGVDKTPFSLPFPQRIKALEEIGQCAPFLPTQDFHIWNPEICIPFFSFLLLTA